MYDKINEIIINEFVPDFNELIIEFPELKKYLLSQNKNISLSSLKENQSHHFDWSNKDLTLLLTKCILNHYFNIKFYSIPQNFLIPPVPSRLNYINIIKNLLDNFYIKNENIIGIDIGTGANIIYPLLGNAKYKWKFVCSEFNNEAFINASMIIKNNNLEKNICLIKQKFKNNILIGIINREKKYNFTMCNPPYFDYENEIKAERNNKDCEYNFDEIYYKNGENGFVEKLFKESIGYYGNIFLFTILIGKKNNAENIYDSIANNNKVKLCKMIKVKTGNNMRYIIYWSFFENYEDFCNLKLYSTEFNRYKPIIQYVG